MGCRRRAAREWEATWRREDWELWQPLSSDPGPEAISLLVPRALGQLWAPSLGPDADPRQTSLDLD